VEKDIFVFLSVLGGGKEKPYEVMDPGVQTTGPQSQSGSGDPEGTGNVIHRPQSLGQPIYLAHN
jgi:hypothetical protein